MTIFYDYILDELRLKDVPDGSGGFYGSFYDTTTHTVASTTTAYPITLNTTLSNNGVSIGSPTSRIVFDYAGIYSITFSVQYENTDNQAHASTIWLRKNGTDVPDSSSYISVPSRHGGTNGKILTTVNFVLDLNANDYIEVYYQAESTDIQIVTIPAGTTPTTPVSPSIILTAVQGGIITQGSTTNSLASLTDVSFTSLASGQIIMSNASGNWGNINFPAIPSIPSLGSLAVMNQLSFTSLTNQPSLGSLAFQNIVQYSQVTGVPSLGSLAVMNQLSFTSLTNQPSLGSIAFQNTVDYSQLTNTPSLGSLAMMNQLSFTSLLNQPSLSSLAFQSTIDYTSAQLTNKPSLGSLSVMNQLSFTSLTNQPSLSSLAFQSTVDYVTQVTSKPSLGSLAPLNSLSYGSLLNLPSLGSLSVMNQLSFTSLTNQPSLSSLAFQSTIDYTSAQLTNKPSLGSLAPLDSVTQTYLPSSASFSILDTNGIVNASTVSTYQLNAYKATATLLSLGSTGNDYGRLEIINNFDADTNNLYPYGIFQQTIDTDLFGYDSFGGYFESIKKVGANTTVFGHRARGFFSPSAVSQTLQGLQATSNQIEVKNYGTVNFAETLTTNATVENSTIGELRLLRLYTPTLSGNATINALYGAFIANVSIVANNWSIYSEGGNMYHAGNINIGNGHLKGNSNNAYTSPQTVGTGDILSGDATGIFQFDASAGFQYLQRSSADAVPPIMLFYKSRGATNSPSAITAGDTAGRLSFYAFTGASVFDEVARMTAETTVGADQGVFRFSTAPDRTTGPVERLTILPSGLVGVGVANPVQRLDVNGVAQAIDFYASDTDAVGSPAFTWSTDTNTGMYNASADVIGFTTAGVERMRVGATGNVGIGTTTTTVSKLHIDQSNNAAVLGCLTLDQADASEEYFDFVTPALTAGNPVNTTALGTYYGRARVRVNGTQKWIAIYND